MDGPGCTQEYQLSCGTPSCPSPPSDQDRVNARHVGRQLVSISAGEAPRRGCQRTCTTYLCQQGYSQSLICRKFPLRGQWPQSYLATNANYVVGRQERPYRHQGRQSLAPSWSVSSNLTLVMGAPSEPDLDASPHTLAGLVVGKGSGIVKAEGRGLTGRPANPRAKPKPVAARLDSGNGKRRAAASQR